ncbi:hypothetical protein QRX50_06575 [Amycolatopsis carbonis]|uniref:Uncharacterized protein n=1 Tax=Amycolatopsis carbonis TaxID=715471 RepID=A0A9Y2MX75_9PSEU|nr:hypothetical protein [Amycolatopsis sp. 2-15]WIX80438.1 hypothetical protein QRX50_06575 [Amycolatopsis sp. 2-15]
MAAAAPRVPDPELESDHASARVVELVTGLFKDKTSRSVDRTMAHFARKPMYYTGSFASHPRSFRRPTARTSSLSSLRRCRAAARLNAALGRGDTTGLFAEDAVFEDLALRSRIVGRQAIDACVARASDRLPYGRGATIRHTVGSHLGGGYEWTNASARADHGIIAIELDGDQRISRSRPPGTDRRWTTVP